MRLGRLITEICDVAVVVAIACVAMGCAAHASENMDASPTAECSDGSTYDIRISPALAPEWHEAEIGALAAWSRVLGDSFRYEVRVTADAAPRQDMACVISVVAYEPADNGELGVTPVTSNGGGFNRPARPGSAFIEFRSTLPSGAPFPDDVRHAIALHETGHLLGLAHDEDWSHDSIMFPKITTPGRLGCIDAVRACAIWGCVPPVCTVPSWLL